MPITAKTALRAAAIVKASARRRRVTLDNMINHPRVAADIESVRALIRWTHQKTNSARQVENSVMAFLSSYRCSAERMERRSRRENGTRLASFDHLTPGCPAEQRPEEAVAALTLVAANTQAGLERTREADQPYGPQRETAAQHWELAAVNLPEQNDGATRRCSRTDAGGEQGNGHRDRMRIERTKHPPNKRPQEVGP